MTVLVLTSAHGAPGVTTTALALTWVWPSVRPTRRVLLVDADPAGSGLLSGWLRGELPETAGVSVLAATRGPLSAAGVVDCSVALDGDASRMVLPGVVEPSQARPLAGVWTALADAAVELSSLGVDVVVDAGRVGHRHEPAAWWPATDVLAVVARGDVGSVVPTAAAIRALSTTRAGRSAPIGLVVDPGSYRPAELATALGADVVQVVSRDASSARAVLSAATGGSRFDRSVLARSARSIVEQLTVLAPDANLESVS